jgi:hypothetical protein
MLALLTMLALGPAAQEKDSPPVYALVGIKSSPQNEAEARVLENRLLSELIRLGVSQQFSITTPRDRDILLREMEFSQSGLVGEKSRVRLGAMQGAQGVIIGDLVRSGNLFFLHVSLIKTATALVIGSAEASRPGLQALLDEARPLVYRLLELPPPAGSVNSAESGGDWASVVNPTDLAGTWKGDKGLESVTIEADGSAVAQLGGWNSMRLRVSVTNDRIVVLQDEANSPKLYMSSFPYAVAAQIADVARPMRWVLRLSANGRTLSGTKETSFFHIEQGKLVSVDNSYSREAVWVRLR